MIKFLYIMGNVAESLINNIPVIILGAVLLIVGLCKDYGAEYFGISAAVVAVLYIVLAIIRKVRSSKDKL